jgi:CRP-like cAMP-binding protein
MNNASGIGNISKTISENNIGLVQEGQWLGEELHLLKVPLLYSAIAVTDVKLFKVSIEDFESKFP